MWCVAYRQSAEIEMEIEKTPKNLKCKFGRIKKRQQQDLLDDASLDDDSKWLYSHNIPELFRTNLIESLELTSGKCRSSNAKKNMKDVATYLTLNHVVARELSHTLSKGLLNHFRVAQQDSTPKPLQPKDPARDTSKKQKK